MGDGQPVWIGTSWKMNKTLAEALHFAERLAAAESESDGRIQRFVIPPFTAVRQVKDRLKSTSLKVGAQNMHWAEAGAWTGEISPEMLKDCGLDMVELGHSERREHFGETDETVARKTAAAVRNALIPLICVGETFDERTEGRADDVLERQTRMALSQLSDREFASPILFAYEPVWAIGERGVPATVDYAEARQAKIRAIAAHVAGRPIPCLYGGSVNPGNCADFIVSPYIDGLFIGRSAWDVEGYLGILTICSQALARKPRAERREI